MIMKNPPHPGRIVRQECLEAYALTVGQLADALGISRKHLSQLINGKASITADMAVRLSKAVGNDADFWLRLQRQFDLAEALTHSDKIKVKKLQLPIRLSERAAHHQRDQKGNKIK